MAIPRRVRVSPWWLRGWSGDGGAALSGPQDGGGLRSFDRHFLPLRVVFAVLWGRLGTVEGFGGGLWRGWGDASGGMRG